MIWTDFSILAILLLSGLASFLHGFVKEVLGLIAWLLSFGVALSFVDKLTNWLTSWIPFSDLRVGIALMTLFLTAFILLSWINYLIINSLATHSLSLPERILGTFFGLLKGGVMITWLIMLAGLTHLPIEAEWWRQSLLIQSFKPIVLVLRHQLPANLAKQFNFDPAPPPKSTVL